MMKDTAISSVTFSSFLSSLSILNTITPIISGAFANQLGVGRTAIYATGLALVGQLTVFFGQSTTNFRFLPTMIGLAMSSCAYSPLLVIQETVVLSNVEAKSAGLYMALGLLSNKFTSWLGGASSLPLYEHLGRLSVFFVSTCLAFISFLAALMLARLTADLTFSPKHSHEHLPLMKTTQFGDAFWVYATLCIFCGANWYAFVPLSPSILESIFDAPATTTSLIASLILFTSIILYLPVGHTLDKLPFNGIFYFFIASASLTLTSLCLLWSAFLKSEFFSILPYAIGFGYSPLITVLAANRIVTKAQVSLALGVHKSLEMAGSVLSQEAAGWILESSDSLSGSTATYSVLRLFICINLIQLCLCFLFLHVGNEKRQEAAPVYEALETEPDVEMLERKNPTRETLHANGNVTVFKRGRIAFWFCTTIVGLAWIAFAVSAIHR